MWFKKRTMSEEKNKTRETEQPAPESPTPSADGAKDESEAKAANAASEAKADEAASEAGAAVSASEGAKPDAEKSAELEKPAEPDWKTLYARTLADFDNFKKRAARDREDVYRYAESDILKDVLPTVDNLALALANAKDKETSEFVKGVQLVYDGLLKALADHGAKPMADLVGKEPDPNLHEAIATLPSDEVAEGLISTVVKTGWTLNDRLLRAAQVVVSAGKKEDEAENPSR